MREFEPKSIDYTANIRLKDEFPNTVIIAINSDFEFAGYNALIHSYHEMYIIFSVSLSYSTIALFPKDLIVNVRQLRKIVREIEIILKKIKHNKDLIFNYINENSPANAHWRDYIGKDNFLSPRYNESIYLYCSEISIGKDRVREFFENRNLRVGMRDLDYYQQQWEARRPDVFISHDSVDKSAVAEPLYHALTACGLKVWLDKYTLNLGDSLTEKINEGIAECRYGVLILSKTFLANERWAKRELNSFSVKDAIGDSHKLIPVWHGISEQDLVATGNYWLIDKLGGSTSDIEKLAGDIARVVSKR